jgi:uncharacterized protein (TIGR04255 family)
MPDNQNQNGRFEPLHEAHAIEQVIFVVQIDRPLDDTNIAAIYKVAEQFQPELPGRVEIQGFALTIGSRGPSGPISAGRVFSRTRPDGTTESELRVERDSVTFRTSLYTRWNEIWGQARKYFDAIVPMYVGQANISGISLNYVDKFLWVGVPAECRPNILLRPESIYLCPYVYNVQDLWHSHTGAFMRVSNETKRLLNVNVDCLDENRPNGIQRVVAITTVLSDLINQPGYAPSQVAANAATEFLDTRMRQLHDFGKEVFGKIINDDMCRRIALVN